ncbi:HAS-barrel domain-containing protein [Candidatus Oscillochloris fontis]|uniref:HAS-barrel domain-containing protein n=1 Tax=Candidatus Oscillochloris fontis TaxID=2496868 RepID=UPI00101B6EC9|nr:HAS-barrel domain-containing protein [Candidatus Oscillochloris fontis]
MLQRIGEVIESATTRFTAGVYTLLQAPTVGTLVRAQTTASDLSVYGLVYEIRTVSREPGGRAVMRGRTYSGRELYDDEIYQAHPDLAEVLQTEFSALTVGFRQAERYYQYLPPHPPPVHYSVYPCDDAELVAFGGTSDFFRTLLFSPQIPGDDVLATLIRKVAQAHPAGHDYLIWAGRELASLLNEDYDRLIAILRKIKP